MKNAELITGKNISLCWTAKADRQQECLTTPGQLDKQNTKWF